MQTRQNHTLFALNSAEAFISQNADRLTNVTTTGMRTKLSNLIAELKRNALGQGTSNLNARGTTQKHRQLRTILVRDHMNPIAAIAAAELPRTPELAPLRKPGSRFTAANLAHAAGAMAEAAAPFSDVFIAAGLPADFIAQLRAASDAMLEAIQARSLLLGKRSGATSGLSVRLTAAKKVLHAVDSLVRRSLSADPELLNDWNTVKRVKRPTQPVTPAAVPAGNPAAIPVVEPAAPVV